MTTPDGSPSVRLSSLLPGTTRSERLVVVCLGRAFAGVSLSFLGMLRASHALFTLLCHATLPRFDGLGILATAALSPRPRLYPHSAHRP